MKTTQKHQSFLANSSRKYFKFGLAGSILFSIGVFKLPIYAETPHWDPPTEPEVFEIEFVSEFVREKEKVEPEEIKDPLAKNPVVAILINANPTPEPSPEPIKVTPVSIPPNAIQLVVVPPVAKKKPAYNYVEQMPEFKGGLEALYVFFGRTIQYNKQALEHEIEGKVHVRFIIEPDGSISNVEIAKGVDPLLDNEALRVVKSMPAWNPGIQNGEKVRVVMVLPINFVIK